MTKVLLSVILSYYAATNPQLYDSNNMLNVDVELKVENILQLHGKGPFAKYDENYFYGAPLSKRIV